MQTLHLILVFLHLVGMASLLGGFLAQMTASTRRVVPAMVHGALTQLVTGVLLVLVPGEGQEPDHAKVGVKGVVLLAILGLMWLNRHRPHVSERVYFAIGGLTLLNVAIAVFWT
jgi:hypothetical protein